MMNSEKQLIIAGDNNQAATIARMYGLRANQYESIRDPMQIASLRHKAGRKVWLFGTYYRRPSWDELQYTCKACGVEMVEIGEPSDRWTMGDPSSTVPGDIELTCRALKACGYRVHIKERNGTQWVTATKGLNVRYEHWHPLTNISQAMQLLQDADMRIDVHYYGVTVYGNSVKGVKTFVDSEPTPQTLINAQCRAIVTACAALEPVR